MQLSLPEIASPICGWSIDTRTLQPGDLYFALRGENHDGHDYVATAFEKGAAGVVVDRAVAAAGPAIHVADTLTYLQELALDARVAWAGTIVGVTGSAGKTSTKDAVAHLLSSVLAVGKTSGNFNNHIGVPLSILRLPDSARAGVLEMGMNHAGEIRDLCRIAKPEIGVVTNVGHAHIEFFGSVEGIALAKRELIESLPVSGSAVLNADDEHVRKFADVHPGCSITFGFSADAKVRAEMVDGSHFRCLGTVFETQLSGRHAVSNILAAIAVATIFGIPAARLLDPVRTLAPGRMRGERIVHNGVIILNDSYNSNPAAASAMLDVLRDTPARRRIAVLGEMLELGDGTERLHRDLGKRVVERGIDVLIGIRGGARFMVDAAMEAGLSGKAAYFFDTPDSAGAFLREVVHEGDAILFKGSRGVQVERALAKFTQGEGVHA